LQRRPFKPRKMLLTRLLKLKRSQNLLRISLTRRKNKLPKMLLRKRSSLRKQSRLSLLSKLTPRPQLSRQRLKQLLPKLKPVPLLSKRKLKLQHLLPRPKLKERQILLRVKLAPLLELRLLENQKEILKGLLENRSARKTEPRGKQKENRGKPSVRLTERSKISS
jgi:hypothetical protein